MSQSFTVLSQSRGNGGPTSAVSVTSTSITTPAEVGDTWSGLLQFSSPVSSLTISRSDGGSLGALTFGVRNVAQQNFNDPTQFNTAVSDLGFTYGSIPGVGPCRNGETYLVNTTELAIGCWLSSSSALTTPSYTSTLYDVMDWGSGVTLGWLVLSDPTDATVLGKTFETPAGVGAIVTRALTFYRYSGTTMISNLDITFELRLGSSVPVLALYHYADSSTTGTELTSLGGTITDCTPFEVGCFLVTAPSTSSFIGFAGSSSTSSTSSSSGTGSSSDWVWLSLLALVSVPYCCCCCWWFLLAEKRRREEESEEETKYPPPDELYTAPPLGVPPNSPWTHPHVQGYKTASPPAVSIAYPEVSVAYPEVSVAYPTLPPHKPRPVSPATHVRPRTPVSITYPEVSVAYPEVSVAYPTLPPHKPRPVSPATHVRPDTPNSRRPRSPRPLHVARPPTSTSAPSEKQPPTPSGERGAGARTEVYVLPVVPPSPPSPTAARPPTYPTATSERQPHTSSRERVAGAHAGGHAPLWPSASPSAPRKL